MSYLRWDERYQQLLNQWAVRITSKLVANKRHSDVIALMVCLNNFDFLENMGMNFHEINHDANEWFAMNLSVLASDLSGQNWNVESNDQQILRVLCEISDFLTVNQLDGNSVESLDFPQRLKIPASKPICFSFDF